jgi:hypothetical protein
MESACKEGKILLAINAIDRAQIQSERLAAKAYDVPRSTLQRRRAGTLSRRDCEPNSRKLTKLEESVIIEHIIDLDLRGFSPKLGAVADMANHLLTERGAGKVGIKWPSNFVKRTPELKTRFNRKYDYQRAKCEDPQIIQPWFELVRSTKAKYGIPDEDVYNFDETGFQMGVISTGIVVTGSERRNRPRAIQPGNREWVTVIQGVNSQGWAIPPFIIFAGQYHLSAWYEEDLPQDWVISLSDNGWTTNVIGLEWIQHFNKNSKDRIKGTHRLLILDGHESHDSFDFKQFCQRNNIITLCMPPHSSHLLQPLDVGCFAPLKKAYGNQVENLMRNHINHITKLEFLPVFRAAFETAITRDNICGGFRGTGLLPYDPEVVLSQLEVRFRTPTPPVEDIIWESKTPGNLAELASQTALIKDKITQHQNSSPTPINDAVDQFLKGAHRIAHQLTLLKSENAALRKANEAASRRKERRKKRLQKRGTLSIGEGSELIAQNDIDQQIQEETRKSRTRLDGTTPRQRRCGRCREVGHRIETCPLNQQAI